MDDIMWWLRPLTMACSRSQIHPKHSQACLWIKPKSDLFAILAFVYSRSMYIIYAFTVY